MSDHSLHHIYKTIKADYKHIYVVPLIRFDFPISDYLFLLYAPFIAKHPKITVHSISVWGHWKFVLAQLIRKKSILHYHWLEFQDFKSLTGMIYKLKMIGLYKLLGGKIVWTIHNITPHDKKWLQAHAIMHRWMAKISTKILVHSYSQVTLITTLYSIPANKIEVVSHPKFPATFFDKKEARNELFKKFRLKINHEIPLIGAFGAISAYKNFEKTIQILHEIDFRGAFLVIGYLKKGQDQIHQTLSEYSKKYDWFMYHPEFVLEQDIPSIMNAFDYCLFNFKDISTSGGFEMARSYKKKIIAPRKGILTDFEGEPDVHLFSNSTELKHILQTLFT